MGKPPRALWPWLHIWNHLGKVSLSIRMQKDGICHWKSCPSDWGGGSVNEITGMRTQVQISSICVKANPQGAGLWSQCWRVWEETGATGGGGVSAGAHRDQLTQWVPSWFRAGLVKLLAPTNYWFILKRIAAKWEILSFMKCFRVRAHVEAPQPHLV